MVRGMSDTDELRRLAEALPTGPWGWFGGESSMYLATKHSGRLYLMAFARRGMNGAQPVFRTGHTITPAAELAQFEVGDRSVVGFKAARKDGSVYRYDIRGFDNDVARWMAACSPDVVLALLDDRYRLRKALEQLCSIMEHCSVTAGVCGCGEDMANHSEYSGHSPTDYGSYTADKAYEEAKAALALTGAT